MKNFAAVFWKQRKDIFRNKAVFIQFVMFPVLSWIMENTVKIDGMPEHFFVNLFAVMYVGMAPLTAMAAVVSEEKEKNTLRVLLMSNVKPFEYFAGCGSCIWMACMAGSVAFAVTGKYEGTDFWLFLGIMAAGIVTALLIGAAIGTWSQSQMAATSVTVPVMILFSFLPMLSMFNETIERFAWIAYSQQIHLLIDQISIRGAGVESMMVILGNMTAAGILFACAYRKSGLA